MLNFYVYNNGVDINGSENIYPIKYINLYTDDITQLLKSDEINVYNILYIDITHDENLFVLLKDIDFSVLLFNVIYFYSNVHLLSYDNCINLITYIVQYLESIPKYYNVVYRTKHLLNMSTYNVMYVSKKFNIVLYYKDMNCTDGLLLQSTGTCVYNSTFNGLFMSDTTKYLILNILNLLMKL